LGKLSEGEQNGQENLEEVEEARSNQAVDQDDQRTPLGIRPSFIVTSARSYSERGLQDDLEYNAGPLPRLQRPFSRYEC